MLHHAKSTWGTVYSSLKHNISAFRFSIVLLQPIPAGRPIVKTRLSLDANRPVCVLHFHIPFYSTSISQYRTNGELRGKHK